MSTPSPLRLARRPGSLTHPPGTVPLLRYPRGSLPVLEPPTVTKAVPGVLNYCPVEQRVARLAHNQEVGGSTPPRAIMSPTNARPAGRFGSLWPAGGRLR